MEGGNQEDRENEEELGGGERKTGRQRGTGAGEAIEGVALTHSHPSPYILLL